MLPQNWQAEIAESFYNEPFILEGLTPSHAISFYQEAHFTTLINALKQTYPLILRILGQDFFTRTAKAYIEHYPAGSSCLADYGEYFSMFLCEYESVQTLVYLPELAEFEWAYHEALFAADAPGLSLPDRETLRKQPNANLTVELHPTIKLMKCHYPLQQIIQWCHDHEAEDAHLDIHLKTQGHMILIHRPDTDVVLKPLENADFIFLNRLQEGYTLEEAISQTEMLAPNYPLEEKLLHFIENKIITAIYA